MTDVMIDIETKGTKSNTVVLSIGAVKFNKTGDDNWQETDIFYMLPDLVEQEIMGRTSDDITMLWWTKQDANVREEAFTENGRELVETVLLKLFKFCEGAEDIWAQGPQFDISILEDLYAAVNLTKPWEFGQVRDSRTWLKAIGDTRSKDTTTAHNALADAKSQARAVQYGFNRLAKMSELWTFTHGEIVG